VAINPFLPKCHNLGNVGLSESNSSAWQYSPLASTIDTAAIITGLYFTYSR